MSTKATPSILKCVNPAICFHDSAGKVFMTIHCDKPRIEITEGTDMNAAAVEFLDTLQKVFGVCLAWTDPLAVERKRFEPPC
jgi:hypothetical protein